MITSERHSDFVWPLEFKLGFRNEKKSFSMWKSRFRLTLFLESMATTKKKNWLLFLFKKCTFPTARPKMEVHYISRQMQQNVTLILIQKSEDEITDPFSYLGQCQLCMNSAISAWQINPKLIILFITFSVSDKNLGMRAWLAFHLYITLFK